MAHEIPYVATATVADLHDLEYKVEKAMTFRGARYLHVFVPCPLGWGAASADTIRLARLAKETGMFPVFEAEHGEVTVGLEDPPAGARSRSTCALQRRFAHLFGDPPRDRRDRPAPGAAPTATSPASGCSRPGGTH